MFQIKICGITSIEDGMQAIEAGADAIGLNFFPASPRYVSRETAAEIAMAVQQFSKEASIVGVFVNASGESIAEIVREVPLSAIQLHGDESVDDLAKIRTIVNASQLKWIRAFRCREPSFEAIENYLARAKDMLDALLLDAYQPGSYGGTGAVVDWDAIRAHRKMFHGKHLVLAGGLNPGNVSEAIQKSAADGVDVASGVELSPGKKGLLKVQSFCNEAKLAFSARSG